MGEALACGEIVDEAAAPGEVGGVQTGLGGDEAGPERAKDPVEGDRAATAPWSEAVEDVEGVQLGKAHPGSAFGAGPLLGAPSLGAANRGDDPAVAASFRAGGLDSGEIAYTYGYGRASPG